MARPVPPSMNVLALDTASPTPAVSLSWEGVITSEILSSDRRASEELLPAVRRLLEAARAQLADLGRIAVCTGPGSFTGLRVGMATAWGLSRGSGVDAEGVSTLEALAEAARGPDLPTGAAVLDAGRGDVIMARFDLTGPRAEPLSAPERVSRAEAFERLRGLPFAALPRELLETPGVAVASPLSAALARAVALAPRPSGPLETTAIYSRPSAAEEKHGAA
jgi:tRNA threonylcarbamoyladenosine biosynthesis protein TsaB